MLRFSSFYLLNVVHNLYTSQALVLCHMNLTEDILMGHSKQKKDPGSLGDKPDVCAGRGKKWN